jgi:hypothetical protein
VRAQVEAIAARVGQLAALQPPDSLKPTFARYASAHRQLVDALRAFAVALGGHGKAALTQAGARAQAAAGEIVRAQDALDTVINGHRK